MFGIILVLSLTFITTLLRDLDIMKLQDISTINCCYVWIRWAPVYRLFTCKQLPLVWQFYRRVCAGWDGRGVHGQAPSPQDRRQGKVRQGAKALRVQCAIERCSHMVVLTRLSPDGGNWRRRVLANPSSPTSRCLSSSLLPPCWCPLTPLAGAEEQADPVSELWGGLQPPLQEEDQAGAHQGTHTVTYTFIKASW